ncbi:MAG TPA: glycoside hydrolase family 30 protein [Candidatus Polarisedimenticolia bacterium]|nr:glycoside hydrolase family 30 protein [Candidatus Polarisedimenticolia bacterium]
MIPRSSLLLTLAVATALPVRAANHVPASVQVYITARDTGQKLAAGEPLSFVEMHQPTEKQDAIFVDSSKTFQTLLGIGGALTDASAETFYKLPKDKQQEVLDAYFDPQKGIGYSLGRTHIHSCDFSSESYTYVSNDDKTLASFNISHDLKYRVPFIKEVLATAGKNNFTIFASPWSPPAWMKDNHDMLHGGKLLPEYYGTWANYCAKFIKAYENEGIPIWGMTVQNEPMAVQTWESCVYTAEEERDFVKNDLGPTFAKDGLEKKHIVIWDHNRGMMYQRAKVVLDDPDAAKYVWGVAYHWYVGDHFENVQRVHQAFPKSHLLFTEGCNGPYNAQTIDDWKWGENYGKSMINDFNSGAEGWTDWNVLLDEEGGPNHVRNFCFAPIHGDTRTGALHYMNSYYYIGHFSKFIRPGAKRIISSSTTDNLITTAFLNKDKNIVVVVMNSTEKDQPFYLWMDNMAAKSASPAHSIMTFIVSGASQSDS